MNWKMDMEMEKRARSVSSGKDQCEAMRPPLEGIVLSDRISELPDEILVDILSDVRMKEAGRTSLLSKRWRGLWTSVHNLDFDGLETLHDMGRKIKFVEAERPIYVRCVNEAIRHHRGLSVDEFTVLFSLNKSCSSDIDNWISFALGKRVKRLKLDLRDEWRRFQNNQYSFPNSLEISTPSFLTSLQMFRVNISGEDLQHLLCNCPNLESVLVNGSETLVSWNVDGPLKLKWLELRSCANIKCLRISAPNLLSFRYFGVRIEMPLKDVPMLVEIAIRGLYSQYIKCCDISEFSCYASQLETLTLDANLNDDDYYIKGIEFPEFPKLKNLTLVIPSPSWRSKYIKGVSSSLLSYTSLINASPRLYKISLQIPFPYKPNAREMLKADTCPHNIKVVEFYGFQGRDIDTEFALYLIENAVMLEKITFSTRNPLEEGMWIEYDHLSYWDRAPARERAREIGKGLPAGTELIIL